MNDRPSTHGGGDLYQNLFRYSAVSLWIQDISELREIIDEWQARGIEDVRGYLDENRDEYRRAVHAIKVVDVNDAALSMYEVADKTALLGPLDKTLDLEDPQIFENLSDDITSVVIGREHRERESSAISPSGKRMDVELKVFIPLRTSELPYMLVNVIDITERKQLERKLEEERTLSRTLIDNLPEACYLKDSSGHYLLANKAMADMVGAGDAAHLVGRTDSDLYTEEAVIALGEEDSAVVLTGRRVETERAVRAKGEGVRRVLSAKVPIRNARGEITGLVGIARDVTALRAAEKAVAASEGRYRAIFTNAPVGIFQTTVDGRLLDANPAFARDIGYDTPEELIEAINEAGIASLYSDSSRRARVTSRTLAADEWLTFEGPYRRKDGTTGIGKMKLRSIPPDGDGSVPCFEGFMEDITEQERNRKALAFERVLLRSLMDSTPDRIYFKDKRGRFTLVNRSVTEFLGAGTTEQMVGRTNVDFFSPEFAHAAREDERRIMQTGQPMIDKEESERLPGSGLVWMRTTKMPLRDESGAVVGTFGISRDITNEKLLHVEQIRAERLESLGQLASGIAHHFNNINGAVIGYLDLTAGCEGLSEKARRYLDDALGAVMRSVEVTSRLEILTGAARMATEEFRIETIAQRLLPELRASSTEQSLTWRTSWGHTSPVRGARSEVEFALKSVISNALHALLGRPSPAIHIETREEEEFCLIEVTDNGCGLSQEDSARVFTPFFTKKGEWAAFGSHQAAVKGSGLSLAVARTLIGERGGRIELESVEDRGTTVRIMLPSND